jgi:hypothetical protein
LIDVIVCDFCPFSALPCLAEAKETIPRLVANVRQAFEAGTTLPKTWRVAQIKKIIELVQQNEEPIRKALREDLSVNEFMTDGIEMGVVLSVRAGMLPVRCSEFLRSRRRPSTL